MKNFFLLLFLLIFVACSHTTKVKYESPDRSFEMERHTETNSDKQE